MSDRVSLRDGRFIGIQVALTVIAEELNLRGVLITTGFRYLSDLWQFGPFFNFANRAGTAASRVFVFVGGIDVAKSDSILRNRVGLVDSNDTVPVSMGGTGGKLPADARKNLSAASSGNNNDITGLTGISTVLAPAAGNPNGGIITTKATNSTSTSFVTKGFTQRYGTDSWTMNASFGAYINGSGSAAACGPYIGTFDSGSFGSFWYFIQGGSVIQTNNGNITPVASDERVKNIVREITEDEAVAFITGLKPIRYATLISST